MNSSISIYYNNQKNQIGEIIFNSGNQFGLWEIDFASLVRQASLHKHYQPINKYPAIKRDLAVVVDDSVFYRELKTAILEISELIHQVEYLSIYSLPDNQHSIAFRLIFQSPDRTLESGEVEKILKEIMRVLKERFKAKLR